MIRAETKDILLEAQLCAKRMWNDFDLEIPVDLEAAALKLGIDIYKRPFVEEIDGFFLLLPSAPPIIVINNSCHKSFMRQRFTLAHELGHYFLTSKRKEFIYLSSRPYKPARMRNA